jgi:hypothetical protein
MALHSRAREILTLRNAGEADAFAETMFIEQGAEPMTANPTAFSTRAFSRKALRSIQLGSARAWRD